MITKRALLVTGVYAMLAARASAQEHQHGEDDIPDWYENAFCCNNKDCSPVKAPDSLQFVWYRPDEMVWGPHEEGISEPAFLYYSKDYDGILFKKESFRASLDTRYHRCIYVPRGAVDGLPKAPEPRCLYIPGSV